MFSDPWLCRKCKLEIGVGAAHGRGFDATLFSCRSCGTGHAIENSINHSNHLRHMPGPFFREPITDPEYGKTYVTISWMPFNWPSVEGEFLEEEISSLACRYCNAVDLTDKWTSNDPCPSCGGQMQRKRDLSNLTNGERDG